MSKSLHLLLLSCNDLVNSDGTLNSAGDKAIGCIRNGFGAAVAATKIGLPFDLTKGLLNFAAGPTGCGGIVNMKGFDQLGDIGSLNSLTF